MRSHDHGSSIFQSRLEAPLFHRFNCLLIETHSKSSYHTQVAGITRSVNFKVDDDSSLNLCVSRFLGVFRIDLGEDAWRRKSWRTHTKDGIVVVLRNGAGLSDKLRGRFVHWSMCDSKVVPAGSVGLSQGLFAAGRTVEGTIDPSRVDRKYATRSK